MRKITFNCPHCTSPLTSQLEDAGKHYSCPTCGNDLVMPGIEKLTELRASESRKAEEQARDAARKVAEEKARRARETAGRADREAAAATATEARRIERATAPKNSGVSRATFSATLLAAVLVVYAT